MAEEQLSQERAAEDELADQALEGLGGGAYGPTQVHRLPARSPANGGTGPHGLFGVVLLPSLGLSPSRLARAAAPKSRSDLRVMAGLGVKNVERDMRRRMREVHGPKGKGSRKPQVDALFCLFPKRPIMINVLRQAQVRHYMEEPAPNAGHRRER